MLYPVAILFDIDKKKLKIDSAEVIDELKYFCSLVNFDDVDSLVYLDTDDKILAMCEVGVACTLSDKYNKLDKRNYTPLEFLKDTDLGEGWSDEDTLSFISRCLDNFFYKFALEKSADVIYDSIKIYIEDLKGVMFTFKYVSEMSINCSDTMLKYYKRTVDGFSYSDLGDSNYNVSFNPIVIPELVEDKKYSLIFELALLGYEKKSNEFIEELLRVYKIASELGIDI